MKNLSNNIIKSFWRSFGSLKIQTKLLVSFVPVFVISILAVMTILYINWVTSLRNEAINYSSLYIKQLSENINTYIYELDRLTSMTLADSRVQSILSKNIDNPENINSIDDSRYIEGFLFNIYTLKPDISNIWLIGENGSLNTEGIKRYSLFNINPYDYKWYKEASTMPEKVLIFTDLKDENTPVGGGEERNVSVVRQIRNTESNKFVGCIRIDVPYKKIENIIKKVSKSSSMEIVIINENQNILFDPYSTLKDVDILKFQVLLKKEKDNQDGNMQASIKPGRQTIVYNNSKYTGWNTIGIISNDQLLKKTGKIRDLSIFVALIAILVISVICLFISLGITNPLKKLRSSMKNVENGDFSVKIQNIYEDEIGDIGRSFNSMVFKINELINKEYFSQIKRKEAELKALQAQINPHFLYNTLETLRMKAVVNNDKDVAEMAKILSKFFRFSIIRENELVMVKEELEHVRYYMEIQNLRHNNRFIYIEDFDDELLEARMLKLTLQPIVENAIFHGLEPKVGQSSIILRGRKINDDIMVEIIDNGVGIDSIRLNELRSAIEGFFASGMLGLGLVNVHKRIKFHFGEEYGLNIVSELGKGTRIVIRIPYNEFLGDENDKAINS